jgi:hypothetical protein
MTIEQQLRDQLDRATQNVPTTPDLGTSLSRGRARRRRRGGLVAGAGLVAGTAAAALVLVAALGGTSHDAGAPVATDPTSGAPAVDDGSFVSGTDTDERLEAVVARHLPGLGRADDVYPSDWDHRGPMPDADHADATDWQAAYTVSPRDRLLVIMAYPKPGEDVVPGVIADDSYQDDEGHFTFYSSYVSDSGFTVNALETVAATSLQQAVAERVFTGQDLRALVTDPELTFPFPASRR